MDASASSLGHLELKPVSRLAPKGEARDASGQVIGKDHVEVLTFPRWFLGLFIACSVAGAAGLVAAIALGGGWGWGLGAVTALVGILGAGSWIFYAIGRRAGFRWHFTP